MRMCMRTCCWRVRTCASPEQNVKVPVRNLMGKLGAGSRLEAVSLALQYEVVDPP